MLPNELLFKLKAEDAARLIILEPLAPVSRHKFWHKREMRIRPSRLNTPRQDDMKRLNDAEEKLNPNAKARWDEFFKQQETEFPTIGLMIGPLMRNGQFWTNKEQIENPISLFSKQDANWAKDYSADDLDWDLMYLKHTRDMLNRRFVDGQLNAGAYLDALVFLRADSLLMAETARCKSKYRLAVEVRSRARRPRQTKPQFWKNIGADEATMLGFKHSGYDVRKIDRLQGSHYEVRLDGN